MKTNLQNTNFLKHRKLSFILKSIRLIAMNVPVNISNRK